MKNFRDDIKVNDLAQPFLEPIVEQMTTVFDPEIELDIYNLSLIHIYQKYLLIFRKLY